MNSLEARSHYQPSGGIAGLRFLLALLGLVAAGLAVGVVLELLIDYLLYVGLLYTLVGAMALGGTVSLAVRGGHCRNRLAASAAGVLVGSVAYASFFHIDHCWRRNGQWSAVDSLPDYVDFRMQTDEMIWHGKGYEVRPAKAGQVANLQMPGEQRLNWLNFAVEIGMFAFVPLFFGFRMAGRPYSEQSGRWLERAQIVTTPDAIPELLDALRRGQLAEWAKRPQPLVAPNAPRGQISVWYCPAQPDEEPEWLAYLSVGDLKHLRLEPEEAAALLPMFPGLLELAVPESARHSTPAPSYSDRSTARISRIPEPHAGRLLTPAHAVVANALVLCYQMIPLILVFVHIGIVGVLVNFVGNGINGAVVAVYAIGGIFVPLFLMRWLFRGHANFPINSRYYRWLLRRHLADRPEPLVTFGDPHACFVELVPRTSWGKVVLESAADIGLIAVDSQRRELRFEGDRERWQVPAEAIVNCTVELMPGPVSHDGMYVCVLRVRLPAGEWEWPLVPRTGVEGIDHGARARALCEMIYELQEPSESSFDLAIES